MYKHVSANESDSVTWFSSDQHKSCVIQPSLPLPGPHKHSMDAQGLITWLLWYVIFFSGPLTQLMFCFPLPAWSHDFVSTSFRSLLVLFSIVIDGLLTLLFWWLLPLDLALSHKKNTRPFKTSHKAMNKHQLCFIWLYPDNPWGGSAILFMPSSIVCTSLNRPYCCHCCVSLGLIHRLHHIEMCWPHCCMFFLSHFVATFQTNHVLTSFSWCQHVIVPSIICKHQSPDIYIGQHLHMILVPEVALSLPPTPSLSEMDQNFSNGQLVEHCVNIGFPWQLGTYHRQYWSLVLWRKREQSLSCSVYVFMLSILIFD